MPRGDEPTDQATIQAWLKEQDEETRMRILALSDATRKLFAARSSKGATLGEGTALEFLFAVAQVAGRKSLT